MSTGPSVQRKTTSTGITHRGKNLTHERDEFFPLLSFLFWAFSCPRSSLMNLAYVGLCGVEQCEEQCGEQWQPPSLVMIVIPTVTSPMPNWGVIMLLGWKARRNHQLQTRKIRQVRTHLCPGVSVMVSAIIPKT